MSNTQPEPRTGRPGPLHSLLVRGIGACLGAALLLAPAGAMAAELPAGAAAVLSAADNAGKTSVSPAQEDLVGTGLDDFTDMTNASQWKRDAVEWGVGRGITAGTTKTTFSPDKSCTREQIVTFLYKMAGQPAVRSSSTAFKDVNPKKYYYKAVRWAVENGITSGVSKTSFGVGKPCTRAQIVSFLYAMEKRPPYHVTKTFSDLTRSWQKAPVEWAASVGVTSGTSAGKFSPNAYCTRAQAMRLMYNSVTPQKTAGCKEAYANILYNAAGYFREGYSELENMDEEDLAAIPAGYSFDTCDLDGNGTPELLLSAYPRDDFSYVLIYSYEDGKAELIGGFGLDGEFGFLPGTKTLVCYSYNDEATYTDYYSLNMADPEISFIDSIGVDDPETPTVYGQYDEDFNLIKTLTEDEYDAVIEKYAEGSDSLIAFTAYNYGKGSELFSEEDGATIREARQVTTAAIQSAFNW